MTALPLGRKVNSEIPFRDRKSTSENGVFKFKTHPFLPLPRQLGRMEEQEAREELGLSGGHGGAEAAGRGTWKHAAFHVATTIATPAAFSPLPFALASLGWPVGVTSLIAATFATWYSSFLIASLWGWDGTKHTTYGDLARSIFGVWGYWAIAIFQQIASLGNNIAIQIAAGSCLKAVYKYYDQEGALTLQHFIVFFGLFELVLSQLPDIHSLRWVNALCTFCTIAFAGTTIGILMYNGRSIPISDYCRYSNVSPNLI
uniref:Amino acid transporter transmembrane domain-containing protein n=1 Tax=Kalanchoe fedtschenkoi TaxID=63787 RepID=A0A7N0V5H1_KALFE